MKVLAAFSDACTLHATGSFSTSFCVTRNKCVTESSSFWADVIFLYLAARRGSFLPMFVALRSMSFYGQSVFSFVDGIKQNRATSETSAGNLSKRQDKRCCCMSMDGIQAEYLWRRNLHPLKMTVTTPGSYNHSQRLGTHMSTFFFSAAQVCDIQSRANAAKKGRRTNDSEGLQRKGVRARQRKTAPTQQTKASPPPVAQRFMESDCVDLRMCDVFIGFLVDHWTSQYERVIFVVIAICVDLNTTVRACYFKIGLLQCMLVSYMVMLFHSLLWHVAMSKMGIWCTEKPLCQVSYGLCREIVLHSTHEPVIFV